MLYQASTLRSALLEPGEIEQRENTFNYIRLSFRALTSDPAIKKLLEHPSTKLLAGSLDMDWLGLFDMLLEVLDPFDTIQWTSDEGKQSLEVSELFHRLYSYIINRATAISIIEADDYIIRDCFHNNTDTAFRHFFRAVIEKPQEPPALSTPHNKTLVLDDNQAAAALDVFTNQPLEFKVQECVNLTLGPEERAMFWFTKSAQRPGTWDAEWEYVSTSYAVCFYGDEKYVF